jgi:hypothetical protein
MALTQKPSQKSLFPDIPRDEPFMDKSGNLNPQWLNYLIMQNDALQNYFSPEGYQIPNRTSAEIAQLTETPVDPPTGAGTRVSNNNLIIDSTNNELKINLNGTWKTVLTM